MRLLTFQAKHFRWAPHTQTLEEAPDPGGDTRVEQAVVAFLHLEARDQLEERRPGVFKKTLKHVKWLANKRQLQNVVLHSFTHLGAENAAPEFALQFMEELSDRLRSTGYAVWLTPFGWFSEWEIAVYGESLAKVWKEL